MKANYKIEATGSGLFIAAGNYHSLNEIWYYLYSDLIYAMKHKGNSNIIGIWKPKKLK